MESDSQMKQSEDLSTSASPGLYGIGILTAVVYLLTFFFYLKGPQSHSRAAKEIFAWFIVSLLLFLFWKGYRIISHTSDISPRLIGGFGVLLGVLACLIYPFHSTDIFGYINLGWQQVHYGQNPYL